MDINGWQTHMDCATTTAMTALGAGVNDSLISNRLGTKLSWQFNKTRAMSPYPLWAPLLERLRVPARACFQLGSYASSLTGFLPPRMTTNTYVLFRHVVA